MFSNFTFNNHLNTKVEGFLSDHVNNTISDETSVGRDAVYSNGEIMGLWIVERKFC